MARTASSGGDPPSPPDRGTPRHLAVHSRCFERRFLLEYTGTFMIDAAEARVTCQSSYAYTDPFSAGRSDDSRSSLDTPQICVSTPDTADRQLTRRRSEPPARHRPTPRRRTPIRPSPRPPWNRGPARNRRRRPEVAEMSTTTPTTTETEAKAERRNSEAMTGRPRPGATATGRPDRWSASSVPPVSSTSSAPGGEPRRSASAAAPLTFDPCCTRRLRNCVDGANAAFPDAR